MLSVRIAVVTAFFVGLGLWTDTTMVSRAADVPGASGSTSKDALLKRRNAAVDLFNKGNAALNAKKLKEALQLYTSSIETDPTLPHPYLNRAIVKQDTHDLKGALADATKAIELMPDFASAFNQRALLKQELGDYQGSLDDMNQAIKLHPNDVHYYINRSLSRELLKDIDGAKADIEHALKLDPTNKYALEAKKKVGTAIAGVESVTQPVASPSAEITPTQQQASDSPRTVASGTTSGAKQSEEKLPPLPTSADIKDRKAALAVYSQGVKLTMSGKTNDAIATYTKSIELDPTLPHPYMNRGVARRVLGQLQGARADMNMVIRLMPETPDPYEMLAIIDEAEGSFDAGLKNIDRAISMSPKNPNFYAVRALLLLRKGDFTEAGKLVQKALSMDSQNQTALYVKDRIARKDKSAIEFRPTGVNKAPSGQITDRQRQMRKTAR